MQSGYSRFIYPKQVAPNYSLEIDNSYYMLQLYQAQAFFPASPLVKPAFLTLSSIVESPYQPGQPLKSIYQLVTFQKNQPFQLPIGVNLSSFLPARSTDTIRLSLRFLVTRDNPFQKLAGKIKDINLVAKISAASIEWGTAVKISEVVSQFLGYLLQEGGEDTIFEIYQDINISDLQAGYWIIYGSRENLSEPTILEIKDNQIRADSNLDRFCYAVIKVISIPRLRIETARSSGWWELLQAGKERVLLALSSGMGKRDSALREWGTTLTHVREMARRDQSFLINEIQQIIGSAQKEIDNAMRFQVKAEAATDMMTSYPQSWQDILGVHNARNLGTLLEEYETQSRLTESLLKSLD